MVLLVSLQRSMIILGLMALVAPKLESQSNPPARSESVLQARLPMMKLSSRLRLRVGTERQEGRLAFVTLTRSLSAERVGRSQYR